MSTRRSSITGSSKVMPRPAHLTVPIGELLSQCRMQLGSSQSDDGSSSMGTDPNKCTQEKKKPKSTTITTNEGFSYFCSLENFESAVVYLSQELQALGLGHLNLTTSTSSKSMSCSNSGGGCHDALAAAFTGGSHRGTLVHLDLVCLINRCWEVVQLYRASVRDGCVLQEQHKRDANTNNKLQASVTGLQEVRLECDRKVKEVSERRRQAQAESSALQDALHKQKEEVRHLCALLQQRDVQFQHELKKRELEASNLKGKLTQLVAGGGGVVERRLDQSAQLAVKEDRARAKWKTQTDEPRASVDVYRRVLGQYECWLSELSGERDCLTRCLESAATGLQALARKHAKVLGPEDMAASLTESVYSTDSLDEPISGGGALVPPSTSGGYGGSSSMEALQRQINDSLLAVTVVLAERASGDLREARVKRIHELTASAHLYSSHNPGSACRGPPTPAMAGSRLIPLQDATQGNDKSGGGDASRNGRHSDGRNDKNGGHRSDGNGDRHGNDGKNGPDGSRGGDGGNMTAAVENSNNNNRKDGGSSNSAFLQLAKHLGIIASSHSSVERAAESPPAAATAGASRLDAGTPVSSQQCNKSPSTSTPDIETHGNPDALPDTPNITTDFPDPSCQGTPDLPPHNPHTPVTGPDESWLRQAGGPDDSTGTEVMTLKRLLEEERHAVKKERERYASAALRLNRERAAFEQDKVSLLRLQFLEEVPDSLQQLHLDGARLDPSLYQASRVPAWLSEHHHRPFSSQHSPQSPSPPPPDHRASGSRKSTASPTALLSPPSQQSMRFVALPNITPPPPITAELEGKKRGRPVVLGGSSKPSSRDNSGGSNDSLHRTRLSSHPRASSSSTQQRTATTPPGGGRRSAPATRAPSLARSSGDGSSLMSLARAPPHQSTSRRSSPIERYKLRRTSPSETRNHLVRELSLPTQKAAGGGSSSGSYRSAHQSLSLKGTTCRNNSRESSVSLFINSAASSKSRESSESRTNLPSRESSRSRNSSAVKHSLRGCESPSSGKYSTLPRSSKLSSHRVSDPGRPNEEHRDDERGINAISFSSHTEDERRGSIVSRVTLNPRQGAETPPSRFGMRKSCLSRSSKAFNSNSLPRQLGMSHPHLISSITDGDVGEKLDRMRHARTMENVMSSSTGHHTSASGDRTYPSFDITTVPGLLAATRYSMAEGRSQSSYHGSVDEPPSRPKSDSFTQAVDLNDMYASLPPEFMSRIDSNEVFCNPDEVAFPMSGDPASCTGDCKKFLKVPSNASCLCHLLKRKVDEMALDSPSSNSTTGCADDLQSNSDEGKSDPLDQLESISQVDSQNLETNARINAIETSLMKLITQITGKRDAAGEGHSRTTSGSSEFTLFGSNSERPHEGSYSAQHGERQPFKERERRERSSTLSQANFRTKEQDEAQKRLSAGILELQNSASIIQQNQQNLPDFVSSMSSKHRNINHYQMYASDHEEAATSSDLRQREYQQHYATLKLSSDDNEARAYKASLSHNNNRDDGEDFLFCKPKATQLVAKQQAKSVADLSAISTIVCSVGSTSSGSCNNNIANGSFPTTGASSSAFPKAYSSRSINVYGGATARPYVGSKSTVDLPVSDDQDDYL